MEPTVTAALVASVFSLCGVTIGVVATLIGSFLSNRYLSRMQREQWDRERKTEQEKWIRNELHEIYINCIYYTTSNDYKERAKWLNLLLIYHPNIPEFTQFFEDVKVGAVTPEKIVELASKDPRLQGDLLKLVKY